MSDLVGLDLSWNKFAMFPDLLVFKKLTELTLIGSPIPNPSQLAEHLNRTNISNLTLDVSAFLDSHQILFSFLTSVEKLKYLGYRNTFLYFLSYLLTQSFLTCNSFRGFSEERDKMPKNSSFALSVMKTVMDKASPLEIIE